MVALLTAGTFVAVVLCRIAWAPYKLWKADEPIRRELGQIKNYRAKANALAGIRETLIDRMNRATPDDEGKRDWCSNHTPWVDAMYVNVEREISPAEAHAIFYIGDASRLPPETAESEDPLDLDYATKMRWLRYYSNTLLAAIHKYSQAEINAGSRP